ncbi:MAG: glycosyltransferase [Nitrososphaerota archaeon]
MSKLEIIHSLERPKVTIGVCVRNCENTIDNAIESILHQDFPHKLMEVIFIDDGSTDNTLSLIKSYLSKMDFNVKIFHHKWRGLGSSRNEVIKHASGEFIVWVDGDMILPPNYVTDMVRFMEENPNVAIAGGTYGMLGQKSLVAFLDNVEYVAYRLKSGSNLPGTGGAIFRVKAIKDIGGFDEKIKGSGEDIDIAFRAKSVGWSIVRDRATFYAYSKKTWKKSWQHFVWHGYGAHYLKHKHCHIISIPRMSPFFSLIAGIIYGILAYKVLKRKAVFLLPIYMLFKNFAWWHGYIKAHMDAYGHSI